MYDCKSKSYTDITCKDASGAGGVYQNFSKANREDYVEFDVQRKFDPSGTEDYVVEVDTPIVMGYAMRRHDEDIERTNDDDELIIDFLEH